MFTIRFESRKEYGQEQLFVQIKDKLNEAGLLGKHIVENSDKLEFSSRWEDQNFRYDMEIVDISKDIPDVLFVVDENNSLRKYFCNGAFECVLPEMSFPASTLDVKPLELTYHRACKDGELGIEVIDVSPLDTTNFSAEYFEQYPHIRYWFTEDENPGIKLRMTRSKCRFISKDNPLFVSLEEWDEFIKVFKTARELALKEDQQLKEALADWDMETVYRI